MLRFTAFERLGLSFAGMSEVSDGDCSKPERRAEVSSALGLRDVALLRQVHGECVLTATASETSSEPREGDGLITREPGRTIGILIADCVPLLLFDPITSAAGVVHAGRAGTFASIAGSAVRALQDFFDVQPENLHAIIGPSAGPCCYEVSQEIADAFTARGLPASRRNLDLWESNALQLQACGVPSEQITVSGICTICDGRFHSHRRHPNGQRNMAFVSI